MKQTVSCESTGKLNCILKSCCVWHLKLRCFVPWLLFCSQIRFFSRSTGSLGSCPGVLGVPRPNGKLVRSVFSNAERRWRWPSLFPEPSSLIGPSQAFSFPSLHLNCESSTIVNKSWWWAGQRHRWGDSLNNVNLRVKERASVCPAENIPQSRQVDNNIKCVHVTLTGDLQ